ncbi:caspase recruitment domain-containing protein 14 isoform X2 [Lepidochelys kempii]|uniref:caspase recruitment domain-containing protein 14 isoform X2 n=1 Tax=Lepidochelys kempii TaxID=8472 RepID=UPI003C6FDF85
MDQICELRKQASQQQAELASRVHGMEGEGLASLQPGEETAAGAHACHLPQGRTASAASVCPRARKACWTWGWRRESPARCGDESHPPPRRHQREERQEANQLSAGRRARGVSRQPRVRKALCLGAPEEQLLDGVRREEAPLEEVPCLYGTIASATRRDLHALVSAVRAAVADEQKKIVWIEQIFTDLPGHRVGRRGTVTLAILQMSPI